MLTRRNKIDAAIARYPDSIFSITDIRCTCDIQHFDMLFAELVAEGAVSPAGWRITSSGRQQLFRRIIMHDHKA